MERNECHCQLQYSIPRATIILSEYKNHPSVIHDDTVVSLTALVLMDYGHLYQVIFSSPEQTDEFDYPLSWCVLSAWDIMPAKSFIEVLIKSKAVKFITDKGYERYVSSTQHRILINNHATNLGTVSCETTWPCSNSAQKQIKHWGSFEIASNLEFSSIMGEHTIYSDKELKIHFKIPIVKVPYYQGTYFKKLVQYYKDVITSCSLPCSVSP